MPVVTLAVFFSDSLCLTFPFVSVPSRSLTLTYPDRIAMFSILSLLTLLSIPNIILGALAQNITVRSNDTSQITYGGGAGEIDICKYDPDGKLIGGQPGESPCI